MTDGLRARKAPKDLREFIRRLESAGELLRVGAEVDAELEITEITDRVSKRGGPALFFERVRGSSMPVLINAFGSPRRIAIAAGLDEAEALWDRFGSLARIEEIPKKISDKLRLAGELAGLARMFPRFVDKGSCQEVVLSGGEVDLGRIPVLRCWPKDGGRFITLPLVFTKDPETGRRNIGVYRMQVLGPAATGMHWQTQKDAAVHARKALGRGKPLEIACVIGADPSTVFAGIVPLPYGMDELLFSGFMRRSGVELVRCRTVGLEVPADAEIVLEGTVDPNERMPEGPFGDHTGVYTPVEPFPVFRIRCITMRRNPVYLTTIVGKPPMEDYAMGKTVERIFLPLIQKQLPEIHDMNFPMEGTFNNAVIVSIDKSYPFQARKVAHAIWGLGQLAYTKVVIVVEKTVNVHDLSQVALAVFNHIDPKRDCFFVEGPVDTLNHASPQMDFGSKMGIDATAKWKEEGYGRVWPDEIEMDEATRRKVTERWTEYGIP